MPLVLLVLLAAFGLYLWHDLASILERAREAMYPPKGEED
jgi:hypothetical protein